MSRASVLVLAIVFYVLASLVLHIFILPSLAYAQATETSITLHWSHVSTAEDAEDGFNIERKEVGGTFTKVGQVAADVLTWSDTTWQPSKKYVYRVAAFNKWGQSGYTNEAGIGTGTPGSPGNLTIEVTVKVKAGGAQ